MLIEGQKVEIMKKKIGFEKIGWYAVIGGIFLLAFVLNCWTPYLADDFAYLFSWADKERITSFWQLFPSIYAHAFSMNGRLVPHFLVQFFALFPKTVFNIANAFMFVLLFVQIAKNAGIVGKHKLDGLYLVSIFAVYWCVIPAFGQVNLWFDGSLNYLWALTLAALFLSPYFQFFLKGEWKPGKTTLILYAVLSLLFGNFSENTTAGAIGGAILILLAAGFVYKHKVPVSLIVNLVLAFLGYVIMYICPAQIANKKGSLALGDLIDNAYNCIVTFIDECGTLVIVWGIVLIFGLYFNMSRKKIWLSVICVLMAVAADMIFMFASYYPERSMCGMYFYMIQANVILLSELRDKKQEVVLTALSFVLCFNFIYPFMQGLVDVHYLYKQSVQREELIETQIEAGKEDLVLPVYRCFTIWSPRSGLKDVVYDATDWPNAQMAEYYGVKSVTGQTE